MSYANYNPFQMNMNGSFNIPKLPKQHGVSSALSGVFQSKPLAKPFQVSSMNDQHIPNSSNQVKFQQPQNRASSLYQNRENLCSSSAISIDQKSFSQKQSLKYKIKFYDPCQAPLLTSFQTEAKYPNQKVQQKPSQEQQSSPFIIVKQKKQKERSRRFRLSLMRKAKKNNESGKIPFQCKTIYEPTDNCRKHNKRVVKSRPVQKKTPPQNTGIAKFQQEVPVPISPRQPTQLQKMLYFRCLNAQFELMKMRSACNYNTSLIKPENNQFLYPLNAMSFSNFPQAQSLSSGFKDPELEQMRRLQFMIQQQAGTNSRLQRFQENAAKQAERGYKRQ